MLAGKPRLQSRENEDLFPAASLKAVPLKEERSRGQSRVTSTASGRTTNAKLGLPDRFASKASACHR